MVAGCERSDPIHGQVLCPPRPTALHTTAAPVLVVRSKNQIKSARLSTCLRWEHQPVHLERRLELTPSPLAGEGWGEGASTRAAPVSPLSPALSRKGRGSESHLRQITNQAKSALSAYSTSAASYQLCSNIHLRQQQPLLRSHRLAQKRPGGLHARNVLVVRRHRHPERALKPCHRRQHRY